MYTGPNHSCPTYQPGVVDEENYEAILPVFAAVHGQVGGHVHVQIVVAHDAVPRNLHVVSQSHIESDLGQSSSRFRQAFQSQGFTHRGRFYEPHAVALCT